MHLSSATDWASSASAPVLLYLQQKTIIATINLFNMHTTHRYALTQVHTHTHATRTSRDLLHSILNARRPPTKRNNDVQHANSHRQTRSNLRHIYTSWVDGWGIWRIPFFRMFRSVCVLCYFRWRNTRECMPRVRCFSSM